MYYVVKTEVYRKEVTWEEVLGVRDEVAKIDIWRITKMKKEGLYITYISLYIGAKMG